MERTENAIARALHRAHVRLLEDLRGLEGTARPSSGEGLPELRARLGATRTHIADHFRFEEQDGYMEAVRKREPRLERAVRQLAEEHTRLARAMDDLIEVAGASATLNDALGDQVRGWVGQVRQHENRENALVQEAFNLDIGAED
jgi:hypothetical protein